MYLKLSAKIICFRDSRVNIYNQKCLEKGILSKNYYSGFETRGGHYSTQLPSILHNQEIVNCQTKVEEVYHHIYTSCVCWVTSLIERYRYRTLQCSKNLFIVWHVNFFVISWNCVLKNLKWCSKSAITTKVQLSGRIGSTHQQKKISHDGDHIWIPITLTLYDKWQ